MQIYSVGHMAAWTGIRLTLKVFSLIAILAMTILLYHEGFKSSHLCEVEKGFALTENERMSSGLQERKSKNVGFKNVVASSEKWHTVLYWDLRYGTKWSDL